MSADSQSPVFHILLVEDNDADVYLLRKALQRAGLNCHLTVLTNGEEALHFLGDPERYRQSGLPQLAVIDLNLPRESGADVLAALRLNRELARTPVAVMTSSLSPHAKARVEELGVDRFLTKPLELAKFLEIGVILKEMLEEALPVAPHSQTKQSSAA